MLNIPWLFFEHLRGCIFVYPTSIFCLVWLFWTGRERFRRSKSSAGIIKGTDTANKSWNISFFEILNIFWEVGPMWVAVHLCEYFCSVRSVVVFVNYATTYSRIRGTEYEWWFMKIHESGFSESFLYLFPQKAGRKVHLKIWLGNTSYLETSVFTCRDTFSWKDRRVGWF